MTKINKFRVWFLMFFDGFLKWNKIFQFSVIFAAAYFSYKTKALSNDVEILTKVNAYLLAERNSQDPSINESPFPWWKKEYNVYTREIIMIKYNESFYKYFLKNLDVPKYYYVGRPDADVFDKKQADVFYKEDTALINRFLSQKPQPNGTKKLMVQYYNNTFVDLNGKVNNDGYWRYVREYEGRVFVYGRMNKPLLD